jgi:hypothetical protein
VMGLTLLALLPTIALARIERGARGRAAAEARVSEREGALDGPPGAAGERLGGAALDRPARGAAELPAEPALEGAR